MQVDDIQGDDVMCTANNHANLDGLVTIFHTERSPDTLNNVQNDLPIMTEDDKSNIKDLSTEFEVDFISLSFTRSGEDIQVAREFLDSIQMSTTKVSGTVSSQLLLCRLLVVSMCQICNICRSFLGLFCDHHLRQDVA